MRFIVGGITAFLLLVISIALTISYIPLGTSGNSLPLVECQKLWSPRGVYSTKEEQNSIESIRKAIELGAGGIEIDFYYEPVNDYFYLSHGEKTIEELDKMDKLVTLSQVVRLFPNAQFWFDYKNLGRLTDEETNKAIAYLAKLDQVSNIKNRVYIEASNPMILERYTQAGFYTLLAVDLLPEESLFSRVVAGFYKGVYFSFDVSAIAVRHGGLDKKKQVRYGYDTANILYSIPTFVFHVPDEEPLLKELVKLEQVKALLNGRDFSSNRFYLNTCPK
ncbi:hypothetical protein N9R79_01405 [Vibrio sp.]|nr:hypothetical protein [Vibrio sp.]